MKVTLRSHHNWNQVKLVPEAASYEKEYEVELPIKEVQRIIELQTEMEELQQKLIPLFEACKTLAQEAYELRKREDAEKAELARIEAEGENLPVELNEEDFARLERPV